MSAARFASTSGIFSPRGLDWPGWAGWGSRPGSGLAGLLRRKEGGAACSALAALLKSCHGRPGTIFKTNFGGGWRGVTLQNRVRLQYDNVAVDVM